MSCCLVPDLSVCSNGPCCSTAPDPSPALQAVAAELAVGYLWAATGRRYGRTCDPITVRPCKAETCKPNSVQDIIYWDATRPGDGALNMGILSYSPTLIGGQPFNIACGCKSSSCCTCRADCEVRLPGPVCEIIDVVVGGVHLGKNAYTVYDHSKLVFRNVGIQVNLPVNTVPLPAGITQVTAFPLAPAGDGVELSAVGSNYQFQLTGGCKTDAQFVVEIPVGNATTTLHVFQPQGFDVVVLAGGSPTVTVAGSTITVGPATVPDTNVRILIRAPRAAVCVDSFIITQDGPAVSPIRLIAAQWSDFTTGSGYCPPCQNYNLPLGEDGTWSVTYTYGEKWPAGAAQIAGLVACEFGQILAGQDTNLPANVQSLVRQGISVEMPNPFDLTQRLMTGNKLVDLWVKAQNPLGLQGRARVWSPDLGIVRRETGI